MKLIISSALIVLGVGLSACSPSDEISTGNASSTITTATSAAPDAAWVQRKESFIPQGFAPRAGDQVWVRVFDGKGQEKAFERYDVTAKNLSDWQVGLAKQLSSSAANQYLQVRAVTSLSTLAVNNHVWLKNPKYTYIIGLRP
jgi:N-acetylglucosamine binding protein domain 2